MSLSDLTGFALEESKGSALSPPAETSKTRFFEAIGADRTTIKNRKHAADQFGRFCYGRHFERADFHWGSGRASSTLSYFRGKKINDKNCPIRKRNTRREKPIYRLGLAYRGVHEVLHLARLRAPTSEVQCQQGRGCRSQAPARLGPG